MSKKQMARRALFASVISLILCCAMLVGTTFAWFTDSVTSGKNQIVAGNLDIELEYKKVVNGVATEWATLDGVSDAFDPNALWEPGRVEVVYLKISNKGTLALKYQLGVNIYSETPGTNVSNEQFKLSDHLVFKVVDMADPFTVYSDRDAVQVAAGTELGLKAYSGATMALDPVGSSNAEDYIALIVYMPESVGNEANYRGTEIPTIELGVQVNATQIENESDSFGDDYDENAWADGFDVHTEQELNTAIANGVTEIDLMADIALTKAVEIPEGVSVTLNLNGKNLTIDAAYDDANATASSAVVNNGTLKLVGKGNVKAINNYTVRNYGTMLIDGITVENGIMNFADLTVKSGNISNSRSGKHTIYGNAAKLTINGGTFYNGNPGNAGIFSYAGEVEINGGEFSIADGTASLGWTSCLLDAQGSAKFTINGGVINGEIRDYNKNTKIYGGTFAHTSYNNFLASGVLSIDNKNGTWTVCKNDSSSKMTLADGAVLDLNGVEFAGTVVAEGDLTIKGDTKIKTLSGTNGGTITIEDGKTLTLTNFSFGAKGNADAEYVITGGTVVANYGFFQHGNYKLYSNFETGYMYYSYGSDITVYGTFHSKGLGDGLDYVRGKVTIANGGKSIHDKSLWVGQPASWGAMEATLIVEEGGFVQANSISVYEGSALYNSESNIGMENAGVKYNSLSGNITSMTP
ncbi:MAG: hypothetical protein J6V25_04435 [Oscillospiraceae bacterium]|nr:hypothetical protein [Oscillospiraceae bacterium]